MKESKDRAPQRVAQLPVRVSAPTHHHQLGVRRCAQGRRALRSGHRAGCPGRVRPARCRRLPGPAVRGRIGLDRGASASAWDPALGPVGAKRPGVRWWSRGTCRGGSPGRGPACLSGRAPPAGLRPRARARRLCSPAPRRPWPRSTDSTWSWRTSSPSTTPNARSRSPRAVATISCQ